MLLKKLSKISDYEYYSNIQNNNYIKNPYAR